MNTAISHIPSNTIFDEMKVLLWKSIGFFLNTSHTKMCSSLFAFIKELKVLL